jgi:hypothetical protein
VSSSSSLPGTKSNNTKAIADDFMRRIFGMEPEDYMISDESALSDFKGVNDLDTVEAIKNRVLECYGFLPLSPYFVDIFTVIESGGGI